MPGRYSALVAIQDRPGSNSPHGAASQQGDRMTSTANGILFRRQIVSGALALLLPACTTWQVGTPTPAEFVTNKHPNLVQVTRTDGSKFDLRFPRVLDDSLMGTVAGGLAQEDSARTLGLPLSEVQSVAARKTSVGKTVALIGGVWLGLGLVALAARDCGDSDSYGGC